MFQGPEITQSSDPNMKVGQKTCRTEYEKQHFPRANQERQVRQVRPRTKLPATDRLVLAVLDFILTMRNTGYRVEGELVRLSTIGVRGNGGLNWRQRAGHGGCR